MEYHSEDRMSLQFKAITKSETIARFVEFGQRRDPGFIRYMHAKKDFVWKPFRLASDFEQVFKNGCIFRYTDKIEYCADWRVDHWKLEANWHVCVKENGSHLVLVSWDSLLLAMHFAYSKQQLKSRRFKGCYKFDFDSVNHSYKILKPSLEYLADVRHNKLTGATTDVFPTYRSQRLLKNTLPKCNVDKELYGIFKWNMIGLLATKRVTGNSWGKKSNCVGTIETCPGEEALLFMQKRDVPFIYVSDCVDKNGYSPIVTAYPKPGVVKSDGGMRVIYPMNITYENALRRWFGDAKVDYGRHRCADGRNFGTFLGYIYDIKSCDKTLYPYLIEFGKEYDLIDLLIPRVCDPAGGKSPYYYGIHQEQFPSGVFHTNLITGVFVKSVIQWLKVQSGCIIQGDGFMTADEIEHPWLRRVQDFNGFKFVDGKWRYARTHRLTEYKYDRGGGPKGEMRYLICWRAYRALDGLDLEECRIRCEERITSDGLVSCRKCGVIVADGCHGQDMDEYTFWRWVSVLYCDIGRMAKTAMEEAGVSYDMRGNSWGSIRHEVLRCPPVIGKTIFPRFQLEKEWF